MYDEAPTGFGGEVKEPVTKTKPKTRAQKVAEWQAANAPAYKAACASHCTCTPSRADMLLMDQWHNPPVD